MQTFVKGQQTIDSKFVFNSEIGINNWRQSYLHYAHAAKKFSRPPNQRSKITLYHHRLLLYHKDHYSSGSILYQECTVN